MIVFKIRNIFYYSSLLERIQSPSNQKRPLTQTKTREGGKGGLGGEREAIDEREGKEGREEIEEREVSHYSHREQARDVDIHCQVPGGQRGCSLDMREED